MPGRRPRRGRRWPKPRRRTPARGNRSRHRRGGAGRSVRSSRTAAAQAPPLRCRGPRLTTASSVCSRRTRPTSLRPVAPSAVRMAASRSRASVLVSDRFARFEQATASTAAIAARSSISPRRAPPTIASASGRTIARNPTLSLASSAASRAISAWRTSSSAWAASIVDARLQPSDDGVIELADRGDVLKIETKRHEHFRRRVQPARPDQLREGWHLRDPLAARRPRYAPCR